MRQWHVQPEIMCARHLLGEHVEHHMILGSLRRGRRLGKHATLGQIDTRTLQDRHDVIANEITRRGMKHNSPLDTTMLRNDFKHVGWFDPAANLQELLRRCSKCRENYEKGKHHE